MPFPFGQPLLIHSLICIGKSEQSAVQDEPAVVVQLHGEMLRQRQWWGVPRATPGYQCTPCLELGGRKEGIM